MKLDPGFKVEKACSRDTSRPVLSCAYLDVDAGVLVATDSYQLAVVPVEVEPGDTSGLIPAAALQAWRKASSRSYTAELSANGAVEVKSPDGSSTFPRPDGQYPDYARLFPEGEIVAEFGVNVKVLAACAAGLGSDVVRVKFISPLRPLVVEPTGYRATDVDGARGIVMPVRLA